MRGRGLYKRGAIARAVIAGVVGVLAVLSGCGGGGDEAELAELAPPDAPLFAEVTVRPEEDQVEAIEAIASKAAGISDPGALLIEEVEESLTIDGADLTWEEDIEPWLGEHGAFFIRSFQENGEGGLPDFAAMFQVDDEELAEDTLNRFAEASPDAEPPRSYGGYDYFYGDDDGGYAIGIVEDALVIGTEDSFKVAVDALGGESLAESDEFEKRTEELGDDRLATLYLEPTSVIDAALASGEIERGDARIARSLLAGLGSGPLGVGIDASADSLSVEAVTTVQNEDAIAPDGNLLGELPAGPAMALALPHLGKTLQLALDRLETSGLPGAERVRRQIEGFLGIDLQADVAGGLGDVSAFVRGTSPSDFVFGVVAGATDPEGPRTLIDAARSLIEREEPRVPIGDPPEGAAYGFTIGVPGLGPSAGAGVFGSDFVASLGVQPQDIRDPDERLEDDELFADATEALGGDYDPLFFLDLPKVLPFLEAGGEDEGRDYRELAPYFEAFRFFIAGAHVEDGLAAVRFAVAVP